MQTRNVAVLDLSSSGSYVDDVVYVICIRGVGKRRYGVVVRSVVVWC